MDRVIFHCDCNGFYASVEEILCPDLRQVPMAVSWSGNSRRGVILAKNELAKPFGVQTAEPVGQARRKCPQLVVVPAHHDIYREFSQKINAIYESYTDQVERFGIDESYLDVTGSLHLFGEDPVKLAHIIRERVHKEMGLTISVGVSFNKAFAKIGSDYKKPNAVTYIGRDNYRDLVWSLPASALLYVGKVTAEAMSEMHIHTIGDLAKFDRKLLIGRFGRMGEQLHNHANGRDDSAVMRAEQEADWQSVGNGTTFEHNIANREEVYTAVVSLADTVASRLRRAGMKCMTAQLTIKDENFKVITRQKGLDVPTWLAKDLSDACMELYDASWSGQVPIRMLTVTALKIQPGDSEGEQLSLFDAESGKERERKRREKLEQAMDHIRNRYGGDSIAQASIVKNDLGLQRKRRKEEEAQ